MEQSVHISLDQINLSKNRIIGINANANGVFFVTYIILIIAITIVIIIIIISSSSCNSIIVLLFFLLLFPRQSFSQSLSTTLRQWYEDSKSTAIPSSRHNDKRFKLADEIGPPPGEIPHLDHIMITDLADICNAVFNCFIWTFNFKTWRVCFVTGKHIHRLLFNLAKT